MLGCRALAAGESHDQAGGAVARRRGDWGDWRHFRIADKIKELAEITSFYLKPVGEQKLPPYRLGQYISVLVDLSQIHYRQSRQYSLSDAPNPEYYRISIKRRKA